MFLCFKTKILYFWNNRVGHETPNGRGQALPNCKATVCVSVQCSWLLKQPDLVWSDTSASLHTGRKITPVHTHAAQTHTFRLIANTCTLHTHTHTQTNKHPTGNQTSLSFSWTQTLQQNKSLSQSYTHTDTCIKSTHRCHLPVNLPPHSKRQEDICRAATNDDESINPEGFWVTQEPFHFHYSSPPTRFINELQVCSLAALFTSAPQMTVSDGWNFS